MHPASGPVWIDSLARLKVRSPQTADEGEEAVGDLCAQGCLSNREWGSAGPVQRVGARVGTQDEAEVLRAFPPVHRPQLRRSRSSDSTRGESIRGAPVASPPRVGHSLAEIGAMGSTKVLAR